MSNELIAFKVDWNSGFFSKKKKINFSQSHQITRSLTLASSPCQSRLFLPKKKKTSWQDGRAGRSHGHARPHERATTGITLKRHRPLPIRRAPPLNRTELNGTHHPYRTLQRRRPTRIIRSDRMAELLMAATVTNDELSAQARLIWRASFLSSFILSLSLSSQRPLLPLFPGGSTVSSPRADPASTWAIVPTLFRTNNVSKGPNNNFDQPPSKWFPFSRKRERERERISMISSRINLIHWY